MQRKEIEMKVKSTVGSMMSMMKIMIIMMMIITMKTKKKGRMMMTRMKY